MKTTRTIIIIFVVIVLSAMFTACSPSSFTASAYRDPASVQALQGSSRIEDCSNSVHQNLINQMRGEAGDDAMIEGVTIGEWLDGKMDSHSCITAAE